MGILKNGPLGQVRKKIGPVVGRRGKRQNILTSLHNVSNKPFTEKQLEVQEKLALLSNQLSIFEKAIQIGFKKTSRHRNPVNEAFSYNYGHAFVFEDGQLFINHTKMVYSQGRIDTPNSVQVVSDMGRITIGWMEQNQSAACQFSDLATILVYNPVKDDGLILLNVVNRYASEYTFNFPRDYAGDTVHCYISFSSADGKHTGCSKYIGSLECVS